MNIFAIMNRHCERKCNMKKSKVLSGYLMVICSAVIYGCMPLMSKYIYEDGVNPATLVFLRNFLALPSLAILGFLQNKTLKIKPSALPSISMIAALGCCVTPLLLFTSYKTIASGTATVLHFVYPAVVVIGNIIFYRQRPKWGNVISVIVCVSGIAMFYDPSLSIELEGCIWALLSGVAFALYVIILPHFKYKEIKGFLFSFYIAAASAVMMFLYCLITKQIALPETLKGWGLCLLFAILITTGAVVLFQQGTFIIGSEKASILGTLEPITAVIVGIVLFGDPSNSRTVIGTLLVILASLLIAVFDMKKSKKA